MPNYQFPFRLNNGTDWDITFTAVRGHVMHHEFPRQCKSWKGFPAKNLFDVAVERHIGPVCTPTALQPFHLFHVAVERQIGPLCTPTASQPFQTGTSWN